MHELPIFKKKKTKNPTTVTGNSPGCFSITNRESTQGASFPILWPKKLQLRAPVHGHTVHEQQTHAAKPTLQVQAWVPHSLLSQLGALSCSNPRITCLNWSHPSAAPSPPSVTDGTGRIRGGAWDGRGTVEVGALRSRASRPHILWAAASSLWAQAGCRAPNSLPDTPGTVSCMATPVSSAGSLLENHSLANLLGELHILAT